MVGIWPSGPLNGYFVARRNHSMPSRVGGVEMTDDIVRSIRIWGDEAIRRVGGLPRYHHRRIRIVGIRINIPSAVRNPVDYDVCSMTMSCDAGSEEKRCKQLRRLNVSHAER